MCVPQVEEGVATVFDGRRDSPLESADMAPRGRPLRQAESNVLSAIHAPAARAERALCLCNHTTCTRRLLGWGPDHKPAKQGVCT